MENRQMSNREATHLPYKLRSAALAQEQDLTCLT